MKSINAKRIAAIAAGAAMVGSTLATGLAAVQTSGDVDSFVQNVKANLNNVEVVVGTNGAEISDGVQAAKLAAVLATLGFEEATDITTVPDTSGVTLGDKYVKVSSISTGETVTPTAESFPLVYQGNTTGYPTAGTSANNAYHSVFKTQTLTPDVLSGVLSTSEFEVEDTSGTTTTKRVEERIIIGQSNVVYGESTDDGGYGLYLDTNGQGGIIYRLDFTVSGQGLSTTASYDETPEVTILGHTYGINTAELANEEFELYSGEKITLGSGDEYETSNGYTIKVTLIEETSGDVHLRVTAPDGSYKVKELSTGDSYDFFNGEVSIAIDTSGAGFIQQNVQTGLATLRIGSGSLKFDEGDPFPLDPTWTVDDIAWDTGNGFLQYIDIRYGADDDDSDPFVEGSFDGTVENGLAEGVVVPGPKNADGDTLFDIQLAGFGGTSNIDATQIMFEASGDEDTPELSISWNDPDGVPQVLDFNHGTYGGTADTPNIADYSAVSTADHEDQLKIYEGQYFFVNDKLLYFDRYVKNDNDEIYPRIYINSDNGAMIAEQYLNDSGVSAAAGDLNYTTFTYSAPINSATITCQFWLPPAPSTKDFMLVNYTGGVGTSCDLYPNVINVGSAVVMDNAYGSNYQPIMDLTYLRDGAALNDTADVVYPGPFPVVLLQEQKANIPAADSWLAIIADTRDDDGFDADETGIDVVTIPSTVFSNTQSTYTNILNITGFAKLIYTPGIADDGDNKLEVENHITPFGTILKADGDELTITIPESTRSTVVKVAKRLEGTDSEDGSSMYTLEEGDTISGLTVEEIGADLMGLNTITCGAAEGTVYTKTAAVNPTALVTTDTAATKTYQIVVGGPFVNKLAQAIDTTGMTTTGAGAQYLIASGDGNKLLTAGFLASDTVAAVNYLIGLLQ
jgi:hypothetical protein